MYQEIFMIDKRKKEEIEKEVNVRVKQERNENALSSIEDCCYLLMNKMRI